MLRTPNLWIDRGVVAVRGIRHLYRAILHLVHAATGVSQSAAIDNLDSQRTIRPGPDLASKSLIHAVDEVNARFVLGQRQADLDIFLSAGRLRERQQYPSND